MADRILFKEIEEARQTVEAVKLVIWDLDDTFWRGTLSEGGITVIAENIELVKQLSARGIVNSICSKNDFAAARAALQQLGLWDDFIFPHIEFAPKGEMIRAILEAAQLRAASALFIDDNPMNLNEALFYNEGLQVAGTGILPALLNDPRCRGKADPGLVRLARYKLLEQKQMQQKAAGAGNIAFLRGSGIRVSLHYDVLDQFPRIHELVNRASQLNFTKRRWPEDEAAALAVAQEEFKTAFNTHWGYVKVADRFGHYGICGFFMLRNAQALHFLFSCRTMNMGVEQFVWHKLGRPSIARKGEINTALDRSPDWIMLVDDADTDTSANASDQPAAQAGAERPVICIRGACDLAMAAHYLRTHFTTIEEYQYPYKSWIVHRTAREIAFADEQKTHALQDLLMQLPAAPPGRFDSAVHSQAADVYVLSFSSEIYGGLKRSRSTGAVLPLYLAQIGPKPYTDYTYDELLARQKQAHLTPPQWEYLQQEYEPVPFLDAALLTRDLHILFRKLAGRHVIVLKLNSMVGASKWHLDSLRRINEIVLPVAMQYGCTILDMAAFVRTTDDLASPDDKGVHFSRDVYHRLAARIGELTAGFGAKPGPRPASSAPAAQPAMPAGPRFDISERGSGNIIQIDETARIKLPVRVHGHRNRLVIGKNVKLEGTILEIIGDDCSVILGDDIVWRGIIRCRHDNAHIVMGAKTTSMHAIVTLHEAGRITIGADCMFSGDVRMDVSDMHSIMDRTTGARINLPRDIVIGDHVWLGHGVMVLKGCHIGSGAVVGAHSVAGGVIPENVVVAGAPARVIRENVEWSRKRL